MSFDDKVFHPLTRSSMKRLVALSECAEVKPYVTRLNLSTVRFTDQGLDVLCRHFERFGLTEDESRLQNHATYAYYKMIWSDEEAEQTGELGGRFVRVLDGLPNVRTIEVVGEKNR